MTCHLRLFGKNSVSYFVTIPKHLNRLMRNNTFQHDRKSPINLYLKSNFNIKTL